MSVFFSFGVFPRLIGGSMCTLKTLAKFCVQNKRLNENARLLCSFGLVQHAISSQWWTVYLLKYWTLLSFAGEDPNAKTPRQAGKKTGVSFVIQKTKLADSKNRRNRQGQIRELSKQFWFYIEICFRLCLFCQIWRSALVLLLLHLNTIIHTDTHVTAVLVMVCDSWWLYSHFLCNKTKHNSKEKKWRTDTYSEDYLPTCIEMHWRRTWLMRVSLRSPKTHNIISKQHNSPCENVQMRSLFIVGMKNTRQPDIKGCWFSWDIQTR